MKNIEPVELDFSVPKEWLKKFAVEIKKKWKAETHFYNNTLNFKSDVSEGQARLIEVAEGVCITTSDTRIKLQHTTFHRKSSGDHNYAFYFDRALEKKLHGEDEKPEVPIGLTEKYSFIVMSSNTNTHTTMLAPGMINNVIIHISRDYFIKNIPVDNWPLDMDQARRFLGYDPLILYGTCNQRMLALLNDLYHIQFPDYIMQLYLKGSIFQLVSQVVMTELEKNKNSAISGNHLADVRKLLDLNYQLQQNLDEPLPTIEQAASDAHMSATKFKDLFKKTFGSSYYNYYKDVRMMLARDLLMSKQHSVSEVAGLVGFMNAGQFSKAFKNMFHILPHELLKTSDNEYSDYVIAELKDQRFRVSRGYNLQALRSN